MSSSVPSIEGFSDFSVLGAGGAGTVFSARDDRHNRQVAVKILTGKTLDNTLREGFQREVQAMGVLSGHPHIANVYQSGFTADKDEPFLVMPLYVGGSFAEQLKARGCLPVVEFLDTAIKLLSALGTAHDRSVLHRDIKPENVFVGEFGSQPVLGDFGISTLIGSGRTTTKAVAYTLSYAAPEVLNGDRQTALSDIYSLGATFYTLLTGTPPFVNETTTGLITKILTGEPDPLPSHIPLAVAATVFSMLERDPQKRPSDCGEIAKTFQTQQAHPTKILINPTSMIPDPALDSTPEVLPATIPDPSQATNADDDIAASAAVQSETKDVNSEIDTEADTAANSIHAATIRQPSGGQETQPTVATPLKIYPIGQEEPTQKNPTETPLLKRKPVLILAALVAVFTLGTASMVFFNQGSNQADLELVGHSDEVRHVAWSPDGATVATTSKDDTAKLWDAASGDELQTLTGHTGTVREVAWSPDGNTIATGSSDSTTKLWDAVSGDELQTLSGHTGWVSELAWSPDGGALVTASEDGTAKVWDVGSGDELHTLSGHSDSVWSVAWSPDGTTIATGSHDGTAKLWDVGSGDELHTLSGHTDSVWSVAWAPDGTTIATASQDTTVRLWTSLSGNEFKTLSGHTDSVWSVAWSPDGTTIATASDDRTARLWDAVSGDERQTLAGHLDVVVRAEWSPNGKAIATASEDGTARIWDAASGSERQSLSGHSGMVVRAEWSPDGKAIATASEDGTARLWPVD